MRLIDAKTLRLELDKLDCIDKFGYVILPITKLNIALERSAVDAVPVCRCKDCKHCFVDGDNVRFNVCELNQNRVQADDWFCADGERKEGTSDGTYCTDYADYLYYPVDL